ncbi:histidine kinase [Geomonas limicola]|uniref:histidine kinase n=1 Tax=Geomonas limicola TaxID=2740186 RepID=A0A6V8N827_9BACT|nr:ATP-binding protein [Geomonas limicola]GFO68651.1 histidine kinase [Geomonas limicola]
MNIATLILFIVADLLLLVAERLTPLPGWVHLAAIVLLAQAILMLWTAFRRREERLSSGLRNEISGMQQQLSRTARRYKSLLEGAGNAIFVLDAETARLQEVNRKGVELFGYSKPEFPGMWGRDLVHPCDQERFRALINRLNRHGRATESDGLTFQKKDGSVFLGEIDARVIDLGTEQLVHCIVRDITEKVRTEQEIWQRNRELSILNNVLVGMNQGPRIEEVLQVALTETLELLKAGGGALYLLQDEGAAPKLVAAQMLAPQVQGEILAELAATPPAAAGVRILDPQAPLAQAAAGEGWQAVTVVPLLAQNQPIGVMHLFHAEHRDYTSEELRFLGSVGTQLGSVIGQHRLFEELNWKSAELLRSYHLLERSSHNLGLSETKLKQNLALVEQANIELSRMDRMKNQFLGMVSHEFNTPLTSIISGAEHLLQQELGAESDQVLGMVRDGGLRLKELVADLLKLVKLEARGDELATSALHLDDSLAELKAQLQPLLLEKRQTLKLTALDRLPYFDGDWKYLERVFSELLLNAMRFSPEGSEIEVTGRVVESDVLKARSATLERFNSDFLQRCGDRCYLEVEVRDQGIGVPAEDQQRIFEIFYEVGDIRHHSSGQGRFVGKGAGLGLAIVKGMVEAHGGMVWVESGQGSSFFVVLPLEQEAIQPALF